MERGVEFLSVTVGLDARTNRPSGMADAVLGPDLAPDAVAKTLSGVDLGGRPIRTSVISRINGNGEDSGHVRKRRRLSDGRYFVSCSDADNEFSINVKCANCGAVGHKASGCSEPPMISPCHLCAGRDHEAGKYG
jgi:hypothetical protein